VGRKVSSQSKQYIDGSHEEINAIKTRALPKERVWEKPFLTVLQETGNVTEAAKLAGIDRRTAYRHYEFNASFREKWDDAIETSTDILEAEARRRALAKSDLLLLALLNANRPHKFRNNYHVETSNRPTSYVVDLGLPDDTTPITDVTPAEILE
jgi:hypothetical protein